MCRSTPLFRLSQILALFALFIIPAVGYAQPALAQPPAAPDTVSFSYSINFLPSTVKRLCVGDSATFRFAVRIQDMGPLAPLTPRQISITTSQGTASPVVFELLGSYGVFQFNYTADSPGDETITVQMVEDTGSASKSFKVLEACEYEVTFFASQQEDVETGGYNVEFWGAGNLSMARRVEEGLALSGDGNDAATLNMYAMLPKAFACGMTPYSGNSTFTMEGTLWPDQDLIYFNIEFKPITFPSHMTFSCNGVGLGAVNFDIPIDQSSGDMNQMNLNGVTVDAAGGTYQFDFGKSIGIITVRKAAQ